MLDSLKIASNNWVKVDNVKQTVTINKAGVVVVGNELRKKDSLQIQVVDAITLVDSINKQVEYHKGESTSLKSEIVALELRNERQLDQNVLNLHDQSLVIAGLSVDLKEQKGKKWTWAAFALVIGTALGFVIGL